MQDNFENNIKNRLQNHEMTPPAMAWENISNALQPDKPKALPWLKWTGIAAAVLIPCLLTVGFLWMSNSSSNKQNSPIISFENTSNATSADSIFKNENNVDATTELGVENQLNRSSANSSSQNVAASNSVMAFIKNALSLEDSNDLQNSEYLVQQPTNEKSNRRVNILSILTSPFIQQSKASMSTPELYASYFPNEEKQLQITTFNMKEDKEEKPKSERKNMKMLGIEVNPYVGTAMLGSLNEQSLIAPEFNSLLVKNQMANTYGSKISYQINDKLKLRSGVGVIGVSQQTYDVPFKFNPNDGNTFYNIQSQANVHADMSGVNAYQNSYASAEAGNSNLRRNIQQDLELIEIPLEMEYKVKSGNKLNVSATGGMSTMVRNKSDIFIADTKQLLGRTTNIKSVSFSANAGIKVDYKITEKVSINVEPQLKYMINTVTANDEIQPYLVGVNAGLSYAL